MPDRSIVYAVISGERRHQDEVWPENVAPPAPLTIGEEILLLEKYAQDARATWALEKRPEIGTLAIVRKIAAIAVRCMETHGAPGRV